MVTREDILKEFNINVSFEAPPKPTPLNFNKFFWWRRYPVSKPLDKHYSFISKINHGDFDYSPYWTQVQYEYYWLAEAILKAKGEKEWCVEKEREIRTIYSKRINKLSEDAAKDEFERLETFKRSLKTHYGGKQEEVNNFVDTFEGSLEECVLFYKLHKKSK